MRGNVRAAESGSPLAGASVSLVPADSRPNSPTLAAVTGDTGAYVFPSVPPGNYFVLATHKGYFRQVFGQKSHPFTGTPVSVSARGTVNSVDIPLIRLGAVEGQIRDRNNEPFSRVTLTLNHYRIANENRMLLPVATAESDDRGHFRLFDVPPGRYYLKATVRVQTAASVESYAPTYYPGVLLPEEASQLTVAAAGEVTGISLAMRSSEVHSIAGRITGEDGRPAVRVVVVARKYPLSENSAELGSAATDQNGAFVLRGLIPGRYRLSVRLADPPRRIGASAVVEVGTQDVRDLALTLAEGSNISGRIVLEGAPGSLDFRKVRIAVVPDLEPATSSEAAALVAADGRFVIPWIYPGAARFRVSVPRGNAYVKTVQLAGVDVTDQVIEFTNRASWSGAEVTVSLYGRGAEGIVLLKEKPAAAATVVLFPRKSELRELPRYTRVAYTGQDGTFSIVGVPPGDYLVCALADLEADLANDPYFLGQIEKLATPLDLNQDTARGVRLLAQNTP